MSKPLNDLHDLLLELKPEGSSHDEATCDFCLGVVNEVASASTDSSGGSVSEKTYTEAEFNALAGEVADLKGKLVELSAAAEASNVDARIAAAKAEVEAQVADLQSKLDAAVLEAEAVKTEKEAIVAFLEGEKTAAEEAAALLARKDERLAKVKEAASFPETYLAENADRFAAMSDEAFEAALEDWKAAGVKKAEAASGAGEIPDATAMTASRSTDGSNPLAEVLGLRFQGVDTRTV